MSQKDIATSLHHKKTSTTDRYVLKSKMSTQAKVVNQLPDVTGKPMELRKTGTHDAISVESPVSLRAACATGASSVEFGGVGEAEEKQKTPISVKESGFINERDGTRTRNIRIDSPVL